MDREFLQTLQVAGQCLSEEVMEAILNQHNADLAAAAADPGASGGNDGRTFSQEEVNRIVSERLARQRLRPADDQREAKLQQREQQLACREYLLQKQYPGKLLELLDTSDPERFKTAADELAASFPGICVNQTPPPLPARYRYPAVERGGCPFQCLQNQTLKENDSWQLITQ